MFKGLNNHDIEQRNSIFNIFIEREGAAETLFIFA